MSYINEAYRPELILLRDAYMGNKEIFDKKLAFLAGMAQPEQWDYNSPEKESNFILKNYLYYTYDRIKQEAKISITKDNEQMSHNYIGKTILTLEWAYVNSRRIVKPDVDWLKI